MQSARMIFFTNAKQDGIENVHKTQNIVDFNFQYYSSIVFPIIREYDKPVLFNKAGVVIHPEALAAYADHPGKIQRRPSIPPTAAPSHVPKVRTNFPETWLWQSIILDE